MTSLKKLPFLLALEERLRILGRVRMAVARVDVQAAQLIVTRAIGREHAAHRALDESFGMLGMNFARGLNAQTAGVTAVAVIEFLIEFLSAQLDFLGIDDDHVIAVVNVRRPRRLVFARQRACNAHRQRAEALPRRVDDVPIVRRLRRLLLITTHAARPSLWVVAETTASYPAAEGSV